MKNACSLLFFLFLYYFSSAQPFTSSNLPIVLIDTHGQTILDSPRIIADMGFIDNGPGNRNNVTDSINDFKGRVTIEIRGSTSQQYPKKSYAFSPIDTFEVETNAMPLGFPAENDFVLYGPYPDKALMRNTFAYLTANRMGHYCSRTRFCEMVLNGVYNGVYELQEKIKRDHNRVNIHKLLPTDTTGNALTGGYIIKIDKTTGSGDSLWYSSYDPNVFFQFHEPKDTSLVQVQRDYVKGFMYNFETALQSTYFSNPDSGFRKYADVNSFIDFFLQEELGHTVDGYRSSCFMYKDIDSISNKLVMGPTWDYNLSYGNANYCDSWDTTGWHYEFNSICSGYVPEVPFWWARLLQDPDYQNQVQCRWRSFRQTFLNTDSVTHWIDSVATVLQESQQRNFITWPILGVYVNWEYYVGMTYADEVNYLRTWIPARMRWMDANLPGTCIIADVASLNENDFTVNPNPATETVNVHFRNSSTGESLLSITDVTGRIVMQQKLLREISAADLNIAELKAGVYFISANGITKRLVKI